MLSLSQHLSEAARRIVMLSLSKHLSEAARRMDRFVNKVFTHDYMRNH